MKIKNYFLIGLLSLICSTTNIQQMSRGQDAASDIASVKTMDVASNPDCYSFPRRVCFEFSLDDDYFDYYCYYPSWYVCYPRYYFGFCYRRYPRFYYPRYDICYPINIGFYYPKRPTYLTLTLRNFCYYPVRYIIIKPVPTVVICPQSSIIQRRFIPPTPPQRSRPQEYRQPQRPRPSAPRPPTPRPTIRRPR